MDKAERLVAQLATDCGGKIETAGRAPDGSGFAVMSMPLPADHWLYNLNTDTPPASFKTSVQDRQAWVARIREAGRYAVCTATDHGKIVDFDPDALIKNLVLGMLGYR